MGEVISDQKTKNYFTVDKELIIILLLVTITAIIFFFVMNQRAFLNFFYLPVLLGAYFYGKRYATQSALLSIILVFIVAYFYPYSFTFSHPESDLYRWLDILTWGGFLLIIGYCMGLLYEKKEENALEIKETYRGIIEMLSLVIDSVDKETQNHSYRVSVIAEQIAREMGCSEDETENIRVAALLHDLGKIGVSAEVLNKIGKLSVEERAQIKEHTQKAAVLLQPVGGKVLNILPLIVSHHETFDGKGYVGMKGENIPLGARIITVADFYDALTSDRSYRKAISPFEAKNEIVKNAGVQFDPDIVKAFEKIFLTLELGNSMRRHE